MKGELPEDAEVVDNRMQEHPQEGNTTEEISKEQQGQPPAQIAPGLMIEQSGGAVRTVASLDGNRVTLSRRGKTIVRHLSALGDDIASGTLSLAAEPESALRRSLIQVYNEGINDPQSKAVTDFAQVTDCQAQESLKKNFGVRGR